ncbi:MAG: cation:proton antiporter [Hyphomicrobiales bacterium]|nr:cation:proton antiporter [Hyphomicrobiales bacterium]
MLTVVAIIICVSMGLAALRVLLGPTPYDRILAANTFGGQTVMLIVVLAVILQESMLIDIALIYALINFIATIGFLKFFAYGSFGDE